MLHIPKVLTPEQVRHCNDVLRKALGAPELTIPRRIVRAPEIPVLGTGKTDYVAVQRIVETEAGAS